MFLGTSAFAIPTLEVLHTSTHSIVGVYTQPDRPVGRNRPITASPIKVKALEFKLPIFQPETFQAPSVYTQLKELKPDLIVVIAYGQILKKEVLALPRWGCINVHSSLLPRWRGAAPIHHAILAGDVFTGVTTQHMAEKLDAGDLLLQETTAITEEDTTQTLHDRLASLGAQLILPTIEGLVAGTLKGRPQDESAITYASKVSKHMETLNPLVQSALSLNGQIRALHPWPGTSLQIEKKRLKIRKAKIHPHMQGIPGQIFEHSGMICLGTPKGCLELQILQWEGKKEMNATQWINGLRGQGKYLPIQTFE